MEVGIGMARSLGGGLDLGRRLIWYGWGRIGARGKCHRDAEASELGVFGAIWVIMGGDGTVFCHKRRVIHKKLGCFVTDIPVCATCIGTVRAGAGTGCAK